MHQFEFSHLSKESNNDHGIGKGNPMVDKNVGRYGQMLEIKLL